ncbi:hypothetical protein ACSBM8_03110 [Sphingomonas sp. ASY06-1R]|uniref:hypothetical protein n=1 Tax=Sphingomonas sp. ASY06-1R TaxID=3445771 RepID=UPI003FA30A37
MPDPNRVMADAEALLQRVSPEGRRLAQRQRQRRNRALMRAFLRIAAAVAAILVAAVAWGIVIGPIGQMGFLAVIVAMAIAAGVIFAMSHEPEETAQSLAASDITLLPQKTEAWLQRQRPALPAPAQRLADGIGLKLEALAPQLVNLDPREPAAAEVRKLLATELPELIDGYTRVPAGLRSDDRNGVAPDKQLVEALGLVDSELARMSADLATGDLNKLATQGRYLELKYKDDQSL